MNGIESMTVEEASLKRSSETDIKSSEPDQKKSKFDPTSVSNLKDNTKEENEEDTSNNEKLDDNKETDLTHPVDEMPAHTTVSSTNSETVTCLTKETKTEKLLSSSEQSGRKTEIDVGITEYLGSHTESFTAIIKQRYSDFIVNEIDEDGNIVHLQNVNHEDKDDEGDEEEKEEISGEAASVLSETDKTAIDKIVQDHNKDATHDITAPEDKDLRTKIHLAVKQSYSQLETKTTEDNQGKKVIRVMWRKGKTRDAVRDEWPKSKKSCRYVRFVLYKENKDTMDAIGLIAKNLKVRESMFQYAGTKDRRAKTTQEITVHRVHPKKLVGLNKVLWNMGLGDFRYVQKPLQLGQLSGNHFVIVLRNVQGGKELVEKALTSLKTNGFVNYFGMQRFGTTSIPTHEIGSALLRGDWGKAIDLILAPRNDVPAKDKFQKKWAETQDPAATLDLTPRFCGLERNILEALVKKAKPFNALEKLPRNTRLLYLHSYQSLVWNKMVSKRLKIFGHRVVAGDLVMKRQGKKDDEDTAKPTLVTEKTVDDYSLTDVVLPLPGHDIIYPDNQVGEWYKDLLTADGLDIDNMKRPQKDYSLPGAYRHLVVIPKDVTWDNHCYNDYTKPLTLSDFDVIQGEKIVTCENGKLSALVLQMSLPPSCYATMALREAMRVDTSSFHQASLNVTT